MLLAVVAMSGCETVQSIRTSIRDSQRPQEGAEVLQYRKLFEAGRRSEAKGDDRISGDTYGWLIGRGSRYGEYGLAMLLLRREPDDKTAAAYLVSCAKRSSNASAMFPDSAMDTAFSVAAMAKLADIAVSRHDRDDVAASLHSMMSDAVTPQVRAWAAEKKADAKLAAIYGDVIAAVESAQPVREYVKEYKWTELKEIFVPETSSPGGSGGKGIQAPSNPDYMIVKFVKAPNADCQYDFEVKLTGGSAPDVPGKVKSEIRRQLVKDFLAAHPTSSVNDVGISYPSWDHSETTIKGTVIAKALKLEVVRRKYDKITGNVTIVVRLGDNDVSAAEKLAIENIEAIATRHNILNAVGAPPPKKGAHYDVIKSKKSDDGLFEIEFKCE